MTRILVATDGSEGGERAVEYASKLAKKDGADLVIVNVISGYNLPNKVFLAFTSGQQKWLKDTLESVSAEILLRARDCARSIGLTAIQLDSRAGDVAQTINEIGQEKSANMIVIGKRGAGIISGLLLGSVAQKVVSIAPIPVMVVP